MERYYRETILDASEKLKELALYKMAEAARDLEEAACIAQLARLSSEDVCEKLLDMLVEKGVVVLAYQTCEGGNA